METRKGKHPHRHDTRSYEVYGRRHMTVSDDDGKVYEWDGPEYVEDRGLGDVRGICNDSVRVLITTKGKNPNAPLVRVEVHSFNPWSTDAFSMDQMTARVLSTFLKNAPQEAIDKLADLLLEYGQIRR